MPHQKVKDILKPEVAEALDGLKGAGPAAAEAPERPPTATVRRRKRPMARPKPVEDIVPEVRNDISIRKHNISFRYFFLPTLSKRFNLQILKRGHVYVDESSDPSVQ